MNSVVLRKPRAFTTETTISRNKCKNIKHTQTFHRHKYTLIQINMNLNEYISVQFHIKYMENWTKIIKTWKNLVFKKYLFLLHRKTEYIKQEGVEITINNIFFRRLGSTPDFYFIFPIPRSFHNGQRNPSVIYAWDNFRTLFDICHPHTVGMIK